MGSVTLTENIKAYLDQLGTKEHDRLLSTPLIPRQRIGDFNGEPAGCIVGCARGLPESVRNRAAPLSFRDIVFGEGLATDDHEGLQNDWRFGLPAEYPHDYWPWVGHPEYNRIMPMFEEFNRLAERDREGTEQAIRDYIVALRLRAGGTVSEPAMAQQPA